MFLASLVLERSLLVTCLRLQMQNQGHGLRGADAQPPSHSPNPGTLQLYQVLVSRALIKAALCGRYYTVGKVVHGACLTFAC